MPRCTAISRAPTAWLPQDSCIRLAHSDIQNRALSPVLASVLAYGVLLSETQYRQWRLILAARRTTAAVYSPLRYTLPFHTQKLASPLFFSLGPRNFATADLLLYRGPLLLHIIITMT